MQFRDDTNLNGIVQHCETLSLLGNGGITGNTVLLKQFTNYINTAYYEVWMELLSVDRRAKTDDFSVYAGETQTNFPTAPIVLVSGQADYTLPVAATGETVSTFLRCNSVYIKNGTQRTYLDPMTNYRDETDEAGQPTMYRVNGKSLVLNCPVTDEFVSTYQYLHVEFQRTPDAFTSADTIQEPGFMRTYHDLLPLKASAIYLLPTNATLAQQYEVRFYNRLKLLKRDTVKILGDVEEVITSEDVNPV